MHKLKLLVGGLVIIGMLSGMAVAATVDTFRLKDGTLQAGFEVTDNCQSAVTDVFYAEATIRTNGTKDIQQPMTFVSVEYVNNCTMEHFILSGHTSQQQVKISGNINSASLSANVPVADDTGTRTATIALNLTFTGTGPISATEDRSKSKGGNVIIQSSFDFQHRPAQATGTIAGVLPLASGGQYTTLTDGPSFSASIGKDAFGQITITTNH